MNNKQIAKIVAKVLYLDEKDQIDVSKSLFHVYAMSWLDFIDFACELQAAANKEFHPDQLWPINAMMRQAELYCCGAWTAAGGAALGRIFDGHAAVPAADAAEELRSMFSVAYVAHRLRTL
jgi:hypothetical protein